MKTVKENSKKTVRPERAKDRNGIKVLHITSSLKLGGAEYVLHTLASHLDPNKFQQTVICFHEGPYVKKLQSLGIVIYKIEGVFFRYDPIFFWRLYRTIKKINPDCIHSMLWAANCAGRLCAWMQSIPIVSVFHNNVDQDGKIRNIIDWLTLRFAHKLVAVSKPVAQSVQKFLGCKKEITIIQNGIIKNVPIAKTRTAFGLNDSHFIIGAVGRFEPIKRFDLLLHCAATLMHKQKHVRLFLIGLGSQEMTLRDLAQNLGIADRVFFLIAKPALEYYSLFDCFVQTTAKEGISIALLEAMSFGVPAIVMHEDNEHPVIRSGKDGLVVNAADSRAFLEGLESLIDDEFLRKKIGMEGQKRIAADFGVEQMVAAYEYLFFSSIQPNQAERDTTNDFFL